MSKNSQLLEAPSQCQRHLGRNCSLVAPGTTDPGGHCASPNSVELPGKSEAIGSPPAGGWSGILLPGTLTDPLQAVVMAPSPESENEIETGDVDRRLLACQVVPPGLEKTSLQPLHQGRKACTIPPHKTIPFPIVLLGTCHGCGQMAPILHYLRCGLSAAYFCTRCITSLTSRTQPSFWKRVGNWALEQTL